MTAADPSAAIAAALDTWRGVTECLQRAAQEFAGDWDAASECGDWTNRQLLAHMATGYVVRSAVLDAVIAGRDPHSDIDLEKANAENVARLQHAPVDEIVEEMMSVRGTIEALLRKLRPEHLSIRTQLAGDTPLGDALPLLCDHDSEHLAELRPIAATP